MSPLGSVAHLHYNICKVKQLDSEFKASYVITRLSVHTLIHLRSTQYALYACIWQTLLSKMTYSAIQAVQFISDVIKTHDLHAANAMFYRN